MADEIKIRRGETFETSVQIEDSHALTAQFIVSKVGEPAVIDVTADFEVIDGVYTALISTPDTDIEEGTYKWMLTIEYDDGVIEKMPTPDCCDDECDLPDFIICETLEPISVS